MLLLCQWWIKKISEGMTVCWRGNGHGQKPVFEAYSRQCNPFVFVSNDEKWKKNFRGGGGRRFAELLDLSMYCVHYITVETELPLKTELKKMKRTQQLVVKTLSSTSNKDEEKKYFA